MRAVVQRVDRASVTVDEKITGEVQKGLLVLLGVAEGDTDKIWPILLTRCAVCAFLRMRQAR